LNHIRSAQPADVETITRVINAAFQRAESFFIQRDRVDSAAVRRFLESGEFLLREDERGIAGCVYVEKRGERAYAGLLAVEPSRQGSGCGSQLMQAAEDHCRQSGCRHMDLRIVNLRAELPEFYRRRGYVQTGTSPFTAGIETKLPCHFINMTKPLIADDELRNR
jgi:N-acetylglutamate synthase-like GNAT family acetyltransferase